MVSSVSSTTSTAYLTTTGTSGSGAATVSSGNSFSAALADATAQGTIVSISDKAKTAAASASTTVTAQSKAEAAAQVASFDIQYSNVGRTQEEYNAHWAAGAAAVSASQGLPAGQYDFTRLSPKEALIIANDATINHGASSASTSGLAAYAVNGLVGSAANAASSNIPQDALSAILGQQVSTPGVDGGAFEAPKDTLKWILSLQGTKISTSLQQSINDALVAHSSAAQRA